MPGFRAEIERKNNWIFIQFFSKRSQGGPILTFRPQASTHLRKSWETTHPSPYDMSHFWGERGQRFVTKPFKSIGIFTVFCYEGARCDFRRWLTKVNSQDISRFGVVRDPSHITKMHIRKKLLGPFWRNQPIVNIF